MWNEDGEKYLLRGKLEGRPVQNLIDSGSSLTMVHVDKVPPSKIRHMEKVPVKCVHGDTEEYPTAEIELCLGGTQSKAKVTVAPQQPIPVLLGRDLYDV